MRGIDIIEALQNIDENLIFRAKHHKKYAPAWLRYVSVAACICCALLLGLLIINRLIAPGEENVPDVLAPPEEKIGTSAPEDEATITLSSQLYPVTLTVPEGYADNVLVDTPFIDNTLYSPFDLDITVNFQNVVFSFHSYFSDHSPSEGMAWLIAAYSLDEYMPFDEELSNQATVLSHTLLGADDAYVYLIIHPGYPEYFYDTSTLESTTDYLQHLRAGLNFLEIFAVENNLDTDPDWRQRYYEFTIAPVEDLLAAHGQADTTTDDNTVADNTADFQNEMFSFGSSYAIEENRINNLQLACDAINGTVLQPGDTFSFNDTLGERTAEKGYKVASVSTTGDAEPVLGGGISQVSSTLYFCCLYSNLEILERHGHVFQPSWASAGRDAAVYWNSQDFRFRNSTAYPIRIDASLSDGRVYIALMSTADDEKYVEIDTSRTTTEDQITYYLTRHIYDMDGNLLRTDTTEQLDAMGGLGSTTYALWQVATEAPVAEVSEYPGYVVTEEDLVFGDGITLRMTPSEVISVFGAPITDEIYGENDMYRMLDYDNALFFFEYCEACGAYQIIECRADAEGAPSMPLGLSIGMSLPEALARFDAEDAQRGQPTTLYYYDDLHWALYQSIYGSDLVYIQLRVGADCSYQINFNRSDQIYSISFSFSSGGLICPYAS